MLQFQATSLIPSIPLERMIARHVIIRTVMILSAARNRTFKTALYLVTAFGLFGQITPAHADQIDGQWCSPSGETMSIEGQNVVTPAGNKVTAKYARHRINYQIPAGERHAGGKIYADQIDDEHIRVTLIKKVQIEPGAHDTWTRCEFVS